MFFIFADDKIKFEKVGPGIFGKSNENPCEGPRQALCM